MQIQTIDNRPPLSAVIALAKAERDPNLPKWRDDMTSMSAEIARKYFRTLTDEDVRDGFNACVNLLSIGLLRSTTGAIEPAAWIQTLRAIGVRGVSRLTVEMIKACDSLPADSLAPYAPLSTTPDAAARSYLHRLLPTASREGPIRAYAALQVETDTRADFKRSIDLAQWLTANPPIARVVLRSMTESFDWEHLSADEVIHRILSVACGVAKANSFAEPDLAEPDTAFLEFPVTTLGPNLFAAARRRYDDLVAKIPSPLRLALIHGESTWFDRYIIPSAKSSKSRAAAPKPPAKAAKKPTRKKSPGN